jgi:predicted acetyltransferase
VAIGVRPCTSVEEYVEAFFGIGQYFGWRLKPDDVERWLKILPLERMLAARDGDAVIGGAGAFPFELSVAGGVLPAGGATVVGVAPTHRRRGVLTAMMRAQLDGLRERGEPLAALWASEERIYGRFGYGMASLACQMRLARDRSGFSAPFEAEGVVRSVDAAEAGKLFPALWDAARATTPGMFARPRAWWETRTFLDPEDRRRGGSEKRYVVWEAEGAPEAYAVYRHVPSFEAGLSTGTTRVLEVVAATPRAARGVWRFLLDIDWAETIEAELLPVDHPLFLLLAEPRRMRFRVGDGLWLRLVDVGAALAARGYAGDGRVVLEVADAFCPWNKGRWKLEGGEAARSDAEPDLRLDVGALGSVYLGAFTFAQLRRALRVEELRPGAVARADRIFRTDVAPWCPEIF